MPAGSTLNKRVLTAQSAVDTTHPPIFALPYSLVTVLVEFGAGTTAGAVVLEAAADPNFAGAWAVLGTASWTVANSTKLFGIAAALPYMRARISALITGGTANVNLAGN